MKKNESQQHASTQRNEESSATTQEPESVKIALSKASNTSASSMNQVKLTNVERSSERTHKHESHRKNSEAEYQKITNIIQETFLEIKHQIVENDPNCFLLLKKLVPLEEEDDSALDTDPILLFQYIKQIYQKTVEIKRDTESKLLEQRESGINDYEVMLQKLEAEVRQHIRIEQQLKLYADSTQAKLDDLEKNNDPNTLQSLKKEIEELRNTNFSLSEKVKKRTNDIDVYKKDLAHKSEAIKRLEQQNETVVGLKSRIKELEAMINQDNLKLSGANTLRSHHRNPKDEDIRLKAAALLNDYLNADGKQRKNSQPFTSSQAHEIKKKIYDKDSINKENQDALKYTSEVQKQNPDSYRVHGENDFVDKVRIDYENDDNSFKHTVKQSGKPTEYKGSQKMKKSIRSENSLNIHREVQESRPTETDVYHPEKIPNLRMSNTDMIESSRFNSDRTLMATAKFPNNMQKSGHEKRRDSRSRNDQKDTSHLNTSSSKQKIPKTSRPSTGYERHSHCPDYSKIKVNGENYDLSRLKALSPQRKSQGRSNSIDNKGKAYRDLKSREDQVEKSVDLKRRGSAFNVQNKQRNSFSTTQRISGLF